MHYEGTVENLKTRLDKFLAGQLPKISRSQIQKDIENGNVQVNTKIVTESKFIVRISDKVNYNYSENILGNKIAATNTPLRVLFNDRGILIIDKPAGLTVHPGAGFKGETLASALLYNFKNIEVVGEEHRPGIVHRLDKDTSGVILVATTNEMYEFLKNAFAERKVKKEYLTLVLGKVEKAHEIIKTPIGKSKIDFRKMTAKDANHSKEAITEYQVLEHLSSGG
jgi:23S rRNA pseudouridine1911/1915/1917 synthase